MRTNCRWIFTEFSWVLNTFQCEISRLVKNALSDPCGELQPVTGIVSQHPLCCLSYLYGMGWGGGNTLDWNDSSISLFSSLLYLYLSPSLFADTARGKWWRVSSTWSSSWPACAAQQMLRSSPPLVSLHICGAKECFFMPQWLFKKSDPPRVGFTWLLLRWNDNRFLLVPSCFFYT